MGREPTLQPTIPANSSSAQTNSLEPIFFFNAEMSQCKEAEN